MGNLSETNDQKQERWSARTNNRYVISAGSFARPHNDPNQPLTAYSAIDPTVTPIEAPDKFIEWLKQRAERRAAAPAPAQPIAKVHEGGRNNYLASRLGKVQQFRREHAGTAGRRTPD